MANGCEDVLFTRGTGQVGSNAPLDTSGNIVVNPFPRRRVVGVGELQSLATNQLTSNSAMSIK